MSIASVRAGKAFVEIGAIDKTGRVLTAVQGRLLKFANKITDIANKAIQTSILIGIPTVGMVRQAMRFDDALRKVQARANATTAQMKQLESRARITAKQFGYTADAVSELQAILAQKGFNAEQIVDMTEPILALARAGGSGRNPLRDIELAADIVSGSMRAFEKGSEETRRVADVFTSAINNSNYALDTLVTSLAYAGPIAHQFKQSLEDTVTIMAMMRDANIEASTAGTATRNMFREMVNRGERFNQVMFELTGKTIAFEDIFGNLRSPLTILKEINRLTEGMGTAVRGKLLGELFEARSVVPLMQVAQMIESGKLEELRAKLDEVGTAVNTARLMNEGFGGSLRILWSHVYDLSITIGQALDPVIRQYAQRAQDVVQRIISWVSQNRQLTQTLAKSFLVLAAIGPALLAIALGLKLIAFVLTPVIWGFALLTKTLGFIMVLVRGLGLLFVSFGRLVFFIFSGKLVSAVATFIKVGLGALRAAIMQVGTVFSLFASGGIAAVTSLIGAIMGIGTALVALVPIVQDIGSYIAGTFQTLKKFAKEIGEALIGAFQTGDIERGLERVMIKMKFARQKMAAEMEIHNARAWTRTRAFFGTFDPRYAVQKATLRELRGMAEQAQIKDNEVQLKRGERLFEFGRLGGYEADPKSVAKMIAAGLAHRKGTPVEQIPGANQKLIDTFHKFERRLLRVAGQEQTNRLLGEAGQLADKYLEAESVMEKRRKRLEEIQNELNRLDPNFEAERREREASANLARIREEERKALAELKKKEEAEKARKAQEALKNKQLFKFPAPKIPEIKIDIPRFPKIEAKDKERKKRVGAKVDPLVPPTVLSAIYKGTAEARQQFQKNLFNHFQNKNPQLEAQLEGNKILEAIEAHTKILEALGGV